MQWDRELDVVVVGSGLGALTSAVCLKELGVESVEVIEKAERFGGTSAVSGGGIWIPNNHYAKACGATDSVDDARAYLASTIEEGTVPEELIETYIQQAPAMLKFVTERAKEVGYISLEHYPDYYMQNPGARAGHRSLEPMPINHDELGDDMNKLQSTHHMLYLYDRIGMTQVEGHDLVTRSKGWMGVMAKLMLTYASETFWRMKHKTKRSRRLSCGSAGVARMYLAARKRNVAVTLNTALEELVQDNIGRVIGIKAKENGRDVYIKARKGVVLGSGGFEYNQELREKYLPKPTSTEWSGGNIRTNTGDALLACLKLGAKTRLMNGAWWCTTISAPDEPAPRLAIMEKSLPGSCVVNMAGKRIANESQNYMAYQTEFFQSHSDDNPNAPAYMVFDKRFRNSYLVGPLLDVQSRPDFRLPKSYFENGFMAKEDSIDSLAQKLGIDQAGLNNTITQMNAYAKTGKDPEFQRGDTEYDRYYGDATVTPNPCLHAIDEGPFYAVRIDPGDFGTHGGMDTSVNAQVLSEATGKPIEGLYAIGNCAAAILPTYPGPGSTLGPAMTFGYQAAKHIASQSASVDKSDDKVTKEEAVPA
ncbi:3-oxosteroid 1-dehydrogenase [Endozoicomonas sp. OPT23]|uniref:FAD-binding protein n=1 Tax=Endozoicomonas sp. OPT23 TaxID=2072845 RepID=UPI00129BAA17|nr:FAD-binding protein [Endozoicomonas sp. OPT23]MRI34686.1 3-oxosteroid 1-dehydrogenase [Endozoicomonas sp. OPT23]